MITEIRAKVNECRAIAEKHYGQEFPKLQIKMDLKGKVGGQALYNSKKKTYALRFNTKLAVLNKEDYLNQTVPHEFAHFIQFCFFPQSQAHGKEWKQIMIQVFKLNPKRCHNYDLSHIEKKTKPYLYSCQTCSKEFQFGPIRHGKMLKNPKRYSCKCLGTLSLTRTLKPRSKAPAKKGMKEISLD